ncbi:hypothetical protein CIN_03280 [Commensalibacter intestini A911]|uniref:Uncharacterized protein n=1 Tax=Commensalibacter intestini A911 TaxID=1088868 RepID=G6EY08_9PROT|nr:hypothetical protein CIN_03280 [Commensalibacter intestini A911]
MDNIQNPIFTQLIDAKNTDHHDYAKYPAYRSFGLHREFIHKWNSIP